MKTVWKAAVLTVWHVTVGSTALWGVADLLARATGMIETLGVIVLLMAAVFMTVAWLFFLQAVIQEEKAGP